MVPNFYNNNNIYILYIFCIDRNHFIKLVLARSTKHCFHTCQMSVGLGCFKYQDLVNLNNVTRFLLPTVFISHFQLIITLFFKALSFYLAKLVWTVIPLHYLEALKWYSCHQDCSSVNVKIPFSLIFMYVCTYEAINEEMICLIWYCVLKSNLNTK